MSTPKGKILHFGLAGHPTDASVSNEKVQALVNEGAEKARAAGYEVQLTFIEVEDFPEALAALKQNLKSGNWDALVVGGGLRVAPPLTPLFEQTINVAKDAAPGMKILFQMAPGDIYETVQRGLGGDSTAQ